MGKLGEKFTDERRAKISKANMGRTSPLKGKKLSQETKDKIGKAFRGKKLSEAHKEKLRNHVKTLEHRKNLSEAAKGSKSTLWRGGLTSKNMLIRESWEYRQWRTDVYKRDNYTCVLCGDSGGRLNADHIKSFAYYPELRFDINNGRTLCVECHYKTDNFGHKAKKEQRELIEKEV